MWNEFDPALDIVGEAADTSAEEARVSCTPVRDRQLS